MKQPKPVRIVPENVSRFDEKKLPKVALLDTTIWLRALGWADDETASCVSFVEAMIHHERRLLIAAPTISELIRGDVTRKVPNRKGIVPVAFDINAAETLGRLAPKAWLSTFPEGERTFIKFDALIVACAKRWGAECVISIDTKQTMKKVADAAGLPLSDPEDYLLPLEAAAALMDRRRREAKF